MKYISQEACMGYTVAVTLEKLHQSSLFWCVGSSKTCHMDIITNIFLKYLHTHFFRNIVQLKKHAKISEDQTPNNQNYIHFQKYHLIYDLNRIFQKFSVNLNIFNNKTFLKTFLFPTFFVLSLSTPCTPLPPLLDGEIFGK